ncbi:Mediator of RNA polymerase II transcription subunit 31 [Friedmanniomyces endolithicus]|uniref:Mediator of RNA polymerase II transcription subunit 31 n=1 Tax=Friedmanniomyces endolithicus TaxID=329885 RepID=A0AAN6QPJ9_9PEZI|nr:Mediator of RNA polymerase II transcription subunit 31 [Friedmanniomyces endolithicus]KAK0827961.1 Mediator of RNA polymerase II transcription subunit 31 [Friedmanniomyces endolithicus]KAK0857791.1 Mediator of RNA polymerase II transcription subunit 31 [Friedmanniomyces endolithicus]KAK0976755.1 Mediator of RNA polymerase II transcription subunit 31 [Friedmanniomyces endolithicus]KAK1007176.1 Mediator of RNA polymerase II transcription subunit 31 [Friedmanniomyces endolithicus]
MATTMMNPNGTTPPSRPRDPDFYAGYTRFEIECEFVQSLSNPLYIQHLALNKYLDDPAFIAYLAYLDYFRRPEYLRFLLYVNPMTWTPLPTPHTEIRANGTNRYPGPTLRALELLQQEQFRKDAVTPALIEAMAREGFEAATAGTHV